MPKHSGSRDVSFCALKRERNSPETKLQNKCMLGSVYVRARAHTHKQKHIRSEGGLICSEVSCKILGHTVTH